MSGTDRISPEKVREHRDTILYEDAAPVTHPLHVRAGAALLVVLVASLMGSGVRLVVPGLKEATRSPVVHRTRTTKVGRWRVGSSWTARWQPLRNIIRRLAGGPPPSAGFPPFSEAEPVVARAPGQDTHFGAIPRRLRWALLGGHGRNGVG